MCNARANPNEIRKSENPCRRGSREQEKTTVVPLFASAERSLEAKWVFESPVCCQWQLQPFLLHRWWNQLLQGSAQELGIIVP